MSDVITIDGPAASGKSSVGMDFAQIIGYQFIDTGAIYRVGTLKALQENVDLSDEEKLAEIFNNLNITFKTENGEFKMFLDGEDVTSKLHTDSVTKGVPLVAAHAKVREGSKKIQKIVGQKQNTVMAGRDIGSVIFPEAKLKFFMTASAEVRAKRRFEQLKKTHPALEYKDVLQDTIERDHKDSTRQNSPLIIPEGAVEIDTTSLSKDQVIEEMMKHYKMANGTLEEGNSIVIR